MPGSSSRRIFLSYRREDTATVLADLLVRQLPDVIPDALVITDVSIEPGRDSAEAIPVPRQQRALPEPGRGPADLAGDPRARASTCQSGQCRQPGNVFTLPSAPTPVSPAARSPRLAALPS